MSRKNKNDDGLDTETTIVDMNVEGFKWYNPTVKKQKKPSDEPRTVRHSVSRKEYWQMVRGAFAAIMPFVLIVLVVFGVLGLLAYLWLG